MAPQPHFLVVTIPAQGHINPSLQFAKRLVRTGANVTFATSLYAHRRMIKSLAPDGLYYASYSDGYDDGVKPTDNYDDYIAQLKLIGARTLSDLVRTLADQGRPVTCLVYTIFLAWVIDVAREWDLPSFHLWIQPATVFSIYYRYFNGYDEIINRVHEEKGPSFSIQFPRLPLLSYTDLPSFILPSDTHTFTLKACQEQFQALGRQEKPIVLVNTFDALEPDALQSIDELNLIGVGPMIPSAFLDGKDGSDKGFDGDLFKKNREDYVEWLDTKSNSSVVYVSFGSIIAHTKQQLEEILNGLLESGRPFLWVIRFPEDDANADAEFNADLRRRMDGTGEGLVVSWCSQVEVLSHPAVGCFVTHCGWNSTTESLSMGIPMVCFPIWTDQGTNAKLVEDVWKSGVRAKANAEGILEGGELTRCLEMAMGESGEEIKKSAAKWKCLAREAAGNGGSSDRNIRAFVEELRGESNGIVANL